MPLDHKISEGVAISRKTTKIAWSNTHGQYPELLAEGESVIYTADIVYEGGAPTLANKKEIMRAKAPECTLEAQDFRKNDTELIYTCYRSPFADVFGVDLDTGNGHDVPEAGRASTTRSRASSRTASTRSSSRAASRRSRTPTTSTSGS